MCDPYQQLELKCQLPIGASCYGRYDLTQDRVIVIVPLFTWINATALNITITLDVYIMADNYMTNNRFKG